MHAATTTSSSSAFLRGNTRRLRNHGTRFKKSVALPKATTTAKSGGDGNDGVRLTNPAAAKLREILAAPGILQAPCAHDALSASLIERAGFKMGFMSGFCVSAARLAYPDTGLISYGEMEDVGRHVCEAVSPGFPFIGDADDGYGNAMNAKRTVRGYARAGFAGILMEDQVRYWRTTSYVRLPTNLLIDCFSIHPNRLSHTP